MKITLYGGLVSDPLMQVTVYCSCAVAVPAGLVLKQQNSPYCRSQRYVNDRFPYKQSKIRAINQNSYLSFTLRM